MFDEIESLPIDPEISRLLEEDEIPIDPEISRLLEERVYEFESPVALNRTKVIRYLRKKSDKPLIKGYDNYGARLSIEDLQFKILVTSPQKVKLICTTVRPTTEESELYMKICAQRLANSLPRNSILEMKFVENYGKNEY